MRDREVQILEVVDPCAPDTDFLGILYTVGWWRRWNDPIRGRCFLCLFRWHGRKQKIIRPGANRGKWQPGGENLVRISVMCDKATYMRSICTVVALFLTVAWACLAAGEKIPIADLPKHAAEQSQLTLPGSQPFHLKAKVFERTDRKNDSHNAEIIEDWVAPDKWRRTIKAQDFSEVLVANGGKFGEQLQGNYYPNWLRTFVDGIFEPGAALQGLDLTKSADTARMTIGPDGRFRVDAAEGPHVCRRFQFLASAPPVTNPVFSTYCFLNGLIESIGTPGYHISYSDYKKFGDKDVARKLGEYIEPGTELQADIEELDALPSADESLFAIQTPAAPLRTITVKEETVRTLISNAPDIEWPPMKEGINPGRLSIYICIDRDGHVRETLPLNSDNPNMTQAAREQVMKWSFKRVSNKGEAVQVESMLTFGYHAPGFEKK